MTGKKPMFDDVDKAYDSFEKKHGGNYHDPDDASAAFDRTSPRIRGEIHARGTHSNREGRLKLYAKDKAGLKHYQSTMKARSKALEKKKN